MERLICSLLIIFTMRSLVNNINNIPIFLGIICHEPLEIEICYTFIYNNCIQLPPNNTLGFHILSLHVVDSNKHYFVVDQVIDMASHSCPTLNMFDMIKHHIGILQITPELHLFDQMNSTSIDPFQSTF